MVVVIIIIVIIIIGTEYVSIKYVGIWCVGIGYIDTEYIGIWCKYLMQASLHDVEEGAAHRFSQTQLR